MATTATKNVLQTNLTWMENAFAQTATMPAAKYALHAPEAKGASTASAPA